MEFQSQTVKVARSCVRKQKEEKDVEDAQLDPLQTRMRRTEAAPAGEQHLAEWGGRD